MTMPAPHAPLEAALTVTDLTRQMQGVLGATFGDVWVRGEISQCRPAASGHVYFTLKDAGAVLPCVLWRSVAQRLGLDLEEGREVLVRGGVDVYPPHGRYQLVARSIEPVGIGALQAAFEQLRARLEAEGLFAPERKRPLPFLPRRIALVTSPTGAAVRDLVTVIRRRMPGADLCLVACRVQGDGSATEVARALAFADRHARADVIVVGRGGGSLEDLWAFNEEVVARAIVACRTPVVSAVGHETDVTIADLVADRRAATPSQAGELVVPVLGDLDRALEDLSRRLLRSTRRRLDGAWQSLDDLAERAALREGRRLVVRRRERLDHLEARLGSRNPLSELRRRAEALAALGGRLAPPLRRRVASGRERLRDLEGRARSGALRALARARERVRATEDAVQARSPLGILARGYSLTLAIESTATGACAEGRVLRAAADVEVGGAIRTRLADGSHLESRVERRFPPGAR